MLVIIMVNKKLEIGNEHVWVKLDVEGNSSCPECDRTLIIMPTLHGAFSYCIECDQYYVLSDCIKCEGKKEKPYCFGCEKNK